MSAEPEIIAAVEEKERQELRDWAAKKIGRVQPHPNGDTYIRLDKSWNQKYYINMEDWRPDDPSTGQIWILAEKMREEGFKMKLVYGDTIQGVLCWVTFTSESQRSYYHNINPCFAILKAARATEKQNGND